MPDLIAYITIRARIVSVVPNRSPAIMSKDGHTLRSKRSIQPSSLLFPERFFRRHALWLLKRCAALCAGWPTLKETLSVASLSTSFLVNFAEVMPGQMIAPESLQNAKADGAHTRFAKQQERRGH